MLVNNNKNECKFTSIYVYRYTGIPLSSQQVKKEYCCIVVGMFWKSTSHNKEMETRLHQLEGIVLTLKSKVTRQSLLMIAHDLIAVYRAYNTPTVDFDAIASDRSVEEARAT